MPTGWYTIQNEADGFKKHLKYSKESIQWLDYIMKTKNVRIKHAENGMLENIGLTTTLLMDMMKRAIQSILLLARTFLHIQL